jgi:hypothetical protein
MKEGREGGRKEGSRYLYHQEKIKGEALAAWLG